MIIPDLEQEINSLKTGQVQLLTMITSDTIDRTKGDSSKQYVSGHHACFGASSSTWYDSPARVRAWWQNDSGFARQTWDKLTDLEITGMMAPSAAGGIDARPLAACLVAEEIGFAAAALPFEMHATALRPGGELAFAAATPGVGRNTADT